MNEPNPVFVLIAVFTPLSIVAITLGLAGIFAYTRQRIRGQELAADLVTQMLSRKMTVDEIERVLLAWSHDPALAKSIRKAGKQFGEMKPEPRFG